MAIHIHRREVLNNIIRFKDSLLDMRPGDMSRLDKEQRTYGILLNRRTGDMRFPEKIRSLESRFSGSLKGSPADWKESHLIVRKEGASELHFEVLDDQDRALQPTDLERLAWEIASETLFVLNEMAKQAHVNLSDPLPEESVLHDLTSIHLAIVPEKLEAHPGWHGSVNRIEAEKRLQGASEGTYLLRMADSISWLTADQLAQNNRLSLYPYVLTVVEPEDKISDYLLFQTERGWVCYKEEPDLRDPGYQYYSTLNALLFSLQACAQHPLSHRIIP